MERMLPDSKARGIMKSNARQIEFYEEILSALIYNKLFLACSNSEKISNFAVYMSK